MAGSRPVFEPGFLSEGGFRVRAGFVSGCAGLCLVSVWGSFRMRIWCVSESCPLRIWFVSGYVSGFVSGFADGSCLGSCLVSCLVRVWFVSGSCLVRIWFGSGLVSGSYSIVAGISRKLA